MIIKSWDESLGMIFPKEVSHISVYTAKYF